MKLPISLAPTLNDGARDVSSVSSADWSSKVEVDAVTAHGSSYHAELCRRGIVVCRISLSGTFDTKEAATRALDLRLRSWIADYETRDRTDHIMSVALQVAPSPG